MKEKFKKLKEIWANKRYRAIIITLVRMRLQEMEANTTEL